VGGDVRRHPLFGCALAVTLVATAACGSAAKPSRPATPDPTVAATSFLSRYVTSDGRVLRKDQGGDIVSEGQAYGLLVAELADRPDTARTIWQWTAAHLRRPDGLLAFHADGNGQIQDGNAAADADVLAAFALLRYTGDDEANLHAQGRDLARAVLGHETVPVSGEPAVVAGNWATATPPTVNPSYWMPGVFTALGRYTGDGRWRQAAGRALDLLTQVTDGGGRLPPDWAQIQDGRLVPTGAPDGSKGVGYGLDAARLPVWLGLGCTAGERRLAASWWTNLLAKEDRVAALSLSVNGDPVDRSLHPLPLLAGAASAKAARDATRSTALWQRAAAQSRRTPTYYGDAWLALGGALLSGSLNPCRDR
jgi:endoglucanase